MGFSSFRGNTSIFHIPDMEHYVLKNLEDQGMLASPQNTQSLKRQASQGLSNFLCKMVQIDFCAILAKK